MQAFRSAATKIAMPAFKAASSAPINTFDYSMKFESGDKTISPWHDIPLVEASHASNVFNYVNEIPVGTKAKMEVATKVEQNPIKQDIKKGNLRFFTYGDIPFNYGCVPQTWEDPNIKIEACGGAGGDNDPIDVVELSGQKTEIGQVYPIKALGVLAMIDEGETDWKVVALPATEEFAKFNTLNDLKNDAKFNKHLAEVVHWFRYYKTTDGKPENSFGFNSEFQDESYVLFNFFLKKVLKCLSFSLSTNKTIQQLRPEGPRGGILPVGSLEKRKG